MIYMDYAATTPVSDAALQMFNEISKHYFGNPSSLHDVGGSAKQILEASRTELAKCFNGESRGLYFTSGGSESNALAILSLVRAHADRGNHLITSQIEHSSVMNTFRMLENDGYLVSYIPVDEHGRIVLEELRKVITDKTIFVSIAHVNSEIGTVQPIQEIGEMLRGRNIVFHSDCVQSFGKLPIDVKAWGLHALSISSHKLYGPKGVGACYISPETPWEQTIPNTSHEAGFRPGTVNVPGIASFVTAAHDLSAKMGAEHGRITELSQYFIDHLGKLEGRIIFEGHPTDRLPHIHGLRLKGIEGQYTMLECNRHGIAVSTGSACQAGMKNPSKTMLAIGRSKEDALEFIRVTFGQQTTKEHIDTLIDVLERIIKNYY